MQIKQSWMAHFICIDNLRQPLAASQSRPGVKTWTTFMLWANVDAGLMASAAGHQSAPDGLAAIRLLLLCLARSKVHVQDVNSVVGVHRCSRVPAAAAGSGMASLPGLGMQQPSEADAA